MLGLSLSPVDPHAEQIGHLSPASLNHTTSRATDGHSSPACGRTFFGVTRPGPFRRRVIARPASLLGTQDEERAVGQRSSGPQASPARWSESYYAPLGAPPPAPGSN